MNDDNLYFWIDAEFVGGDLPLPRKLAQRIADRMAPETTVDGKTFVKLAIEEADAINEGSYWRGYLDAFSLYNISLTKDAKVRFCGERK